MHDEVKAAMRSLISYEEKLAYAVRLRDEARTHLAKMEEGVGACDDQVKRAADLFDRLLQGCGQSCRVPHQVVGVVVDSRPDADRTEIQAMVAAARSCSGVT